MGRTDGGHGAPGQLKPYGGIKKRHRKVHDGGFSIPSKAW